MDITQIIGYLAATLAAVIFLPQMIQTIKTKNTKGLSLPSFILISISNSMWLTYGILTGDPAIILSQVFLFPMGLVILAYKIKFG
jgi:MtN3 and saliva related transmembrane protein